jgi:addiction module RelE/StbE family toxin
MGVVRWSDEAERDLLEIHDFIAQQNPAAADRMQALFSRAVKSLQDHPLIYREGRVSGTREIVVHPNYVLIYRIADDAVWIVSVLHSARRYPPE